MLPNNILIIKFGAIGDVLRTTPLLTALKEKEPNSTISWLTDPGSQEVLEGNPLIDHLYVYSDEVLSKLSRQHFSISICLDKEKEALSAVTKIPAEKKVGFGMNDQGDLIALDTRSQYALRLGIDDDLKFRQNKKTYQEISFEQIGLQFRGEEYILELSEEERSYVDWILPPKKRIRVGLNTGSGKRFAGKKLPVESYIRLAEKLALTGKCEVLLLGGPEEEERNHEIEERVVSRCAPILNAGTTHAIKSFASIVRSCDLIITGDTLAMHVAIAMKRPVLTFFASTCAQEIELYGRGEKVVSKIDCAPCYKKVCPIDEQCMKDLSVDDLFDRSMTILSSQKNQK